MPDNDTRKVCHRMQFGAYAAGLVLPLMTKAILKNFDELCI